MMGWALMVVLALLIGAALWWFARVRGPAMQLVAAALLVAMAGYAWQGRPGLAGSPTAWDAKPPPPETAFALLRGDLLGRFTSATPWLTLSESYHRRGDTQSAAAILRSGLRKNPNDISLWIGLGNALMVHGGGTLSPAAELAYRRAAGLAPGHPAPRFFYGFALIETGRIEEGEQVWRDLLEQGPPGGEWRSLIEERLAFLEQVRQLRQQRQPVAQPVAQP